ncbi:putative PurR-regulated permease PerM [Alkalibacillus salilacus]|uniref:PurR-regulated permease PerM n=2 Tax=Alkalibacillus salilacus TaxID=284582 RepID=A0ABT9VFK7_9BACI|nr:putative PurR-regulated permease PerM [Alkalibacillus salilacus]
MGGLKQMLFYLTFFIVMLIGLWIYNFLISASNQSSLDIIIATILATIFYWLIDRMLKRKKNNRNGE